MDTFVVETYLSPHRPGEPGTTIARMVSAARTRTVGGEPVRHVRSIFIPDDETCLLLFEAPSAEVLAKIAAMAGLSPIRIAPAQTTEGD